MKVIIINGTGGSGKDLFVEFFQKNYKYKCLNLSTVDDVKEIAENYLGWDGIKNDKSRKFLSELKRIWKEYNNGPFNGIINKITEFENYTKNKKNIFFVHSREPKEIQEFVDKFGDKCITLLVKRNVEIPNNDSDMNVEKFNYDYIIENNDTIKELELKAIDFIKKVS